MSYETRTICDACGKITTALYTDDSEWLLVQVTPAGGHRAYGEERFDVCSEACLSAWATSRRVKVPA